MSFEKAKRYLQDKGYGDRLIVPERSSATVELAAQAIGVEPGMIAKTVSLLINGEPVLVLTEGTARVGRDFLRGRLGGCLQGIVKNEVNNENERKRLSGGMAADGHQPSGRRSTNFTGLWMAETQPGA